MDTDDKAANTLSNEQLLDYIKKQKAKIKRLEKDKETLGKTNVEQEQKIIAAIAATAAAIASSATAAATAAQQNSTNSSNASSDSHSSSDNSSLFWGLIGRESQFKQKLAKNTLNFLISTITKSSLGRENIPTRSSLFEKWRKHTYKMKLQSLAGELVESSKSFQALEMKTAKLKALLARTHQSNQRFQEDTTSFKKIQEGR